MKLRKMVRESNIKSWWANDASWLVMVKAHGSVLVTLVIEVIKGAGR